jgi:hypothetical protein
MAKKTTTVAKKPSDLWNFAGAKALPHGSAVRVLGETIEENGGMIPVDDPSHFNGCKINLPGLMLCARFLADPTHRENQWACLAEGVRFGNRLYLRLVPSIPMWVKDEWSRTGRPPEHLASFDLERVMAGMTEKPQTATGKNPYQPGSKVHAIFAKASDWIDKATLLDWIEDTQAEGKDKRGSACSLWQKVANRARSRGRSEAETRRSSDGIEQVRLVAVG